MTRLKRASYALAGLFTLVIVLGATVYGVSERRFRRTYTIAPENIASTEDAVTIARGEHLVTTLGCTECHGPGMHGGVVMDAPPMGRIVAPNLTVGPGGVGQLLTPAVIERAVRHGVNHDGHAIPIMPVTNYQHMSDEDMRAVVAYVTHLPPANNSLAPSHLMFLPRALMVAGVMPLLPGEHLDSVAPPASVVAAPTREYGQYLATLAGCTDCHGEHLSGGKITAGDPSWPPSANLTPAGDLGKWTEAQFVSTLRTGARPDGIKLNAPMSAAPLTFGHMTDEELHAIWLYLQSVPPREFGNR